MLGLCCILSIQKIINLPISLNFSIDEIIALVSKIKNDYDKRESIIKTPIELLGEKVEGCKESNSLRKMPKRDKRKRITGEKRQWRIRK